jgi:hypothetical protein
MRQVSSWLALSLGISLAFGCLIFVFVLVITVSTAWQRRGNSDS